MRGNTVFMLGTVAVLAAAGLAFGQTTVTVYNGTFDGLAPGDLNGQESWVSSGGGGGAAPVVAGAPGTGHGQAVRLGVPDSQGANSNMDMGFANLTGPYKQVTVSFDLWRYSETPQWSSNVWWWWWDNGTPTYGLSWDQGSGQNSIFPFGWDAAGYTAPWWYDNWVNVKMTWDFNTGRAHFWLDGWDPGAGADIAISGITTLTGWHFNLGHDEATGSGPETVWLDNFIVTGVTPEPTALALLAGGGLLLRRRR